MAIRGRYQEYQDQEYQENASEIVNGSDKEITQKIMKGRLYDTEEATKIFTCKETLYRSRNDHFFVWSESDDTTGHVSVKPLECQDAQEWLESKDAPLGAYREAGIEIEEV